MSTKKYVYKVYKRGVYAGLLQNVISEFSYSYDINTAGTEVTIEIGNSLEDAGASITSQNLVDETSANIVDQNGGIIITDVDYIFSSIPIDAGNTVEVYLFDSNNINGIRKFSGIITSWKTNFTEDTIVLRVASLGIKLDNYLIATPAASVAESFTNGLTIATLNPANQPAKGYTTKLGQSFQVSSTLDIAEMEILGNATPSSIIYPVTVSVTIKAGLPTAEGEILAFGSTTASNYTNMWTKIKFAVPPTLSTATTYSFIVETFSLADNDYEVKENTGGGYASGALYKYNDTTGWGAASGDMAFRLYTGSGGIGYNFTSSGVSTILRTIMDSGIAQGLPVSYSSTSIVDTGTVATYNFKFNTILDGVKKCLELAPSDMYYTVDLSTSELQFKTKSTVADHEFTIGKHLKAFDIEFTIDDMVNVSYLSGGDTGAGVNLMAVEIAEASLNKYTQWLSNKTDNRVTDVDTGYILARQPIERYADPSYRTVIEIPAVVYDIETISVGQAVGFANAGTFIDALLLQIVGITKYPDYIRLRLDSALPTVSHRIEDIRRNVDSLLTINNPTLPS